MNKQYRDIIARANALHSTGPRTEEGKQRSSMNAFKHNLSGNNLILKPQEYASYKERSAAMLADLKPQTEPERQIAQKIIDLNFRLNRITTDSLKRTVNRLLRVGLTAPAPRAKPLKRPQARPSRRSRL